MRLVDTFDSPISGGTPKKWPDPCNDATKNSSRGAMNPADKALMTSSKPHTPAPQPWKRGTNHWNRERFCLRLHDRVSFLNNRFAELPL